MYTDTIYLLKWLNGLKLNQSKTKQKTILVENSFEELDYKKYFIPQAVKCKKLLKDIRLSYYHSNIGSTGLYSTFSMEEYSPWRICVNTLFITF